MTTSVLHVIAAVCFFAASAFSFIGGNTELGGVFAVLGVVYIALSATHRRRQ